MLLLKAEWPGLTCWQISNNWDYFFELNLDTLRGEGGGQLQLFRCCLAEHPVILSCGKLLEKQAKAWWHKQQMGYSPA